MCSGKNDNRNLLSHDKIEIEKAQSEINKQVQGTSGRKGAGDNEKGHRAFK